MPKLQNPMSDNAAFLASVNLSLKKVEFKAKQNARAFTEKQNPDYWKTQRAKMQNGKSWDILTEWVA